MIEAHRISAGMEVADTEGRSLGTVERVEGDNVMLRAEGSADELHHLVPLAAVTQVGDGRVTVEPATLSSIEQAVHRDVTLGADTPLLGTSGAGTGFGGSGRGEH